MYTNPNLTAIDIRIPLLLFLLFTHVHHNVLQIIMLDSMKIAVIYTWNVNYLYLIHNFCNIICHGFYVNLWQI
jgi:hypothetical protein